MDKKHEEEDLLFEEFDDQDSLSEQSQNNIIHNNNKDKIKYHCPRPGCNSIFTRPYRLMGHLRVHDGIKDFQCLIDGCDKKYTNKSHLVRHMKNVHCGFRKIQEFECTYCRLVCSNKQNLKKHIQRKHEANFTYKCEMCDLGFLKKNMYLAHNYLHTGVMSFECDKCRRSFVTASELNKHSYNHKEYTCAECKETFHNWANLLKHKKVAHTTKEFKCDICQKVFSSRPNIVRHIKTSHDPSGHKLTFMCPYEGCPKYYSSKSNLMCHINSFHLHETFGCYVCNAQLSTEQKLQMHIEKHYREVLPKKNKKVAAPRKDIGSFKRSTAVKLSNVRIPTEMEKQIMEGKKINIDAVVLSCHTSDAPMKPENSVNNNIECIF